MMSRPADATKLSKAMSRLLRHAAEKEGLTMDEGGFVEVGELLRHKSCRGFTLQDLQAIVAQCPKQRFFLETRGDMFYVRANQGHSLHVNVEMEVIEDGTGVVAVHGTYFKVWDSIKRTGLSRMGRQHIHLSAGEPGASGVISGMRASAQLMIYIDVPLAMKDGIIFLRSANNVILTEGADGFLAPKYFLRAHDVKRNQDIPTQ